MRVLHLIASTGTGGAERHLIDLCRMQQAQGLDVRVALPEAGALSQALEGLGVAWVKFRSGGRWDPLALWSLRKLIHTLRPDLIHAHMPKSAKMAGLAKAGVPCIATAHNIVKRLGPFRRCQQVICVSEMVCHTLSQLGYPAKTTHTIHNAVDTSRFVSAQRESIRQQLGWQDRVVMLCVARLVPAKGQQYAIEALAQVLPQHPQACLVLAGAGPDQAKLRTLAKQYGVQDNVSFLGNRNDIPNLLAAADIYLQPSLKEGFGIAFLEAMAAGLACIGTPTGAIPEMIENGINGLIVPVAHAPALALAMQTLIQQPELRQQFASAAANTARTRFSLQRQAADTLAVYALVAPVD